MGASTRAQQLQRTSEQIETLTGEPANKTMELHYSDPIRTLAERIDEVLKPLIPEGSRCVLLDFPNHGNVGDNTIWLGEKPICEAPTLRSRIPAAREEVRER